MPILNAVELESTLRVRLGASANPVSVVPGRLRQAIAGELENMVVQRLLPREVVIGDLPGWCRSMAAKLFINWDGGWSITNMCQAIMATYDFRPTAVRVPVSAYLTAIARSPPEAIAAVEDAERTAALESIALQASLDPGSKMRERQAAREKMAKFAVSVMNADAEKRRKEEEEQRNKERLEEAREANPFQRVIDLD